MKLYGTHRSTLCTEIHANPSTKAARLLHIDLVDSEDCNVMDDMLEIRQARVQELGEAAAGAAHSKAK